jgi:hypothetical protein
MRKRNMTGTQTVDRFMQIQATYNQDKRNIKTPVGMAFCIALGVVWGGVAVLMDAEVIGCVGEGVDISAVPLTVISAACEDQQKGVRKNERDTWKE